RPRCRPTRRRRSDHSIGLRARTAHDLKRKRRLLDERTAAEHWDRTSTGYRIATLDAAARRGIPPFPSKPVDRSPAPPTDVAGRPCGGAVVPAVASSGDLDGRRRAPCFSGFGHRNGQATVLEERRPLGCVNVGSQPQAAGKRAIVALAAVVPLVLVLDLLPLF